MSVVESQDFLNDLNETDFPYLSSKPTGKRADKGRRSGAERVAARSLADQATVVKTIHDPHNVLGKRRKARLVSTCSDNIALDVPYSLNRKNRWEEVDVPALVKNAENTDVEVAIIEQTYKANEFLKHNSTETAQAIQLVATDGSVKSKTARGKGADPISLMHGLKKNNSSSEDDSESDIRLEYRIVKPYSNGNVLCNSGKAGKAVKQRNKTRRNKKVDLDELEISEMDNSFHKDGETDVYKPSRDFRFCLGDYISTPCTEFNAVEVRRASIESVQQLDTEEMTSDGPKPIDLLDISLAVRAPGLFENVIVNTHRWPNFNFVLQVESLASDEELTIRWIDAIHQRVTVDLTKKLTVDDDSKPLLFVVLEKGRKNHFQLLLNSIIPPSSNGPFSWRILKDIFKEKKVSSIQAAIEVIVALAVVWMKRMPPTAHHSLPESRYFKAAENFDVVVNSRSMAKQAAIITEKQMGKILREASAEIGKDSFERIDDDDIISDDSMTDEVDSTKIIQKCHTCMEMAPEELFELDEYWQCRQCLTKHIVNLIRTKNIPMEIPFSVQENGSSFDVLPAIIPLPLINFYTKLTALNILEDSDNQIGELLTCPACNKDVRVEHPNEFSSCLCTNCYTLWCPDCNHEPHWPMSCEQFAEWSGKWEHQFAVESMGDELSKFIRRIHCKCGGITECGDLAERTECRNCGVSFNPSTLKVETKKYYFPFPARYRKYHKSILENYQKFEIEYYGQSIDENLQVKAIAMLPVIRMIKKEFAEPCARVRTQRFLRQNGSKVEKQCRKMKETEALLGIFPDVRRTILCLVEYGLAWIYMNKKANTLKTPLLQLLMQLDELTNDVLEGKSNLGSRVSTLDSALSKMVDQIKKAL